MKPVEVFLVFLKLGLTSFGGPVAHIGYFRAEFVERRDWLSEERFAQLLAVCQFLPGPASSQLGFCIGLHRAGWRGALAAFIAFTLPSALLMFGFAVALPHLSGTTGVAVVHGLKLVACAVVADALVKMFSALCPDWCRRMIAVLVAGILLLVPMVSLQLLLILAAGLAGVVLLPGAPSLANDRSPGVSYGTKVGAVLIAIFVALLFGLPLLATTHPEPISIAAAFYQAGALVFGGGHVVLPLLQETVVAVDWVGPEQFLAGYGAAQAIPGPLFAFSAYLGAVAGAQSSPGLLAVIALLFIFLPGLLLVAGVLPFWQRVSSHPRADRFVAGVNAGVVGLLGAAFFNPVLVTGVRDLTDLAIALIAFLLLYWGRVSPLIVVVVCVLISLVL